MSAVPDVLAERDRRLEQLLADVEAATGPAVWPRVETLVTELLDLHGRALRKLLEHARAAKGDLDERLAADVFVASVLLLHDLHPVPVEARVDRALRALATKLPETVPLVLERIEDGVAVLRTEGEGHPPPAAVIARAVELEAPELEGVDVIGRPAKVAGLVPVERLYRGGAR